MLLDMLYYIPGSQIAFIKPFIIRSAAGIAISHAPRADSADNSYSGKRNCAVQICAGEKEKKELSAGYWISYVYVYKFDAFIFS